MIFPAVYDFKSFALKDCGVTFPDVPTSRRAVVPASSVEILR